MPVGRFFHESLRDPPRTEDVIFLVVNCKMFHFFTCGEKSKKSSGGKASVAQKDMDADAKVG